MKTLNSIIIILFLFNVPGLTQEIITPVGYTILGETQGDLTKDSIDERVVVFNTNDSADFGFIREIIIYTLNKNNWEILTKSRNAILKSDEGGMMGDPFEGVEIKNGILSIYHSGGSSWKWSYTDKYRFQNAEFQLIGYTSINGKPCEYWEHFDFNLSTGKINYSLEAEKCEDIEQEIISNRSETFYKKNVLLFLNNRNIKYTEIISPENEYEMGL